MPIPSRTKAEVRSGGVGTPSRGTLVAREIIGAGVLAGLLGGALMLIWAMVYTAVSGLGVWLWPTAVATSILGSSALAGGLGAILVGVALHASVSIVWGVAIAALATRRLPAAPALAVGLMSGLIVLVIMTFFVLPVLGPTMYNLMTGMWTMWIVAHLLFGLGAAASPMLRRRIAMRASGEPGSES